MKKFIILSLLVAPFAVYAQQAMPDQVRSQFALDRLKTTNFNRIDNAIVGIPVPAGRVVGDTYADSKWNMGSVMITNKNSMVEGYLMKYDVKGQVVEIKTPNGVRLLDVRNVGNMVWLDSITHQPHYFVNAANYTEDNTPLVGLLEVLVDGNRSLFKKTVIQTKQPTYNIALDAGSRDTEIFKKAAYYYNSGSALVLIKNKKKFLEGLGEQRKDVETYMKENKLDVKSADELAKIFAYYNSKLPAAN
jgi:hypothetical protein